jgi:predicted ABC-type transport system involved in lysophospholipase L1 biosynthesis ATPase subunit
LRNDRPLTIVMVTHDESVAASADRTLTIDAGNLVGRDPATESTAH